MKPDEKLFREMAALYIEQEATALFAEMETLPEQDTSSLDRRVRRSVTRLKLRPYIRPAALAAACVALIIIVPQVIKQNQEEITGGAMPSTAAVEQAEDAAEEIVLFSEAMDAAPAEPDHFAFDGAPVDPVTGGGGENPTTAGGGDMPFDEPVDLPEDGGYTNAPTGGEAAIVAEPSSGGENIETGGQDAAPNVATGGGEESLPQDTGNAATMSGVGAASMPMTFALPQSYEQIGYEEDNGKSIYRLRHESQTEVVMVVDPAVEILPAMPDLDVMLLGDQEVYYKYSEDYSQVVFVENGILYDLTCQGELAILLELGEAIA